MSWEYTKKKWTEVKAMDKERIVLLFPVGSIEQHGLHLPLDTDVFLAEEICRQAAARAPEFLCVLPSLPYGFSPHHMDFPGTLSLSSTTLESVVVDVCVSAAHHGFRRILLFNGHGGNLPILEVAARNASLRCPGLLCAVVSWWSPKEVVEACDKLHQREDEGPIDHGGIGETSLYLALEPESVDLSKGKRVEAERPQGFGFTSDEAPVAFTEPWSSLTPTGCVGDPTKASSEKGKIILNAAVDALVKIARQFSQMEQRRPQDHH